jgi:hypothetical protein
VASGGGRLPGSPTCSDHDAGRLIASLRPGVRGRVRCLRGRFDTVLHQGDDPVSFFSKPIVSRHAKLTVYECELIGLGQAVKHWCPYLWGTPFLIRTNHYSLKFLLDQKLATIPQHQWTSKLLRFDFRVEYKPGATNIVADALSCRETPNDGCLYAMSAPMFSIQPTTAGGQRR